MASRYNTVDYPAVGASYQSPSRPASAQRLVNMYPEALDNGLVNVAAHNFPGLKKQLTGNAGEFDRGHPARHGPLETNHQRHPHSQAKMIPSARWSSQL